MAANRGNVFIRVLLALGLGGAAVFVVLAGIRPAVIVAEVKLGTAVDAVPGSVVVHADKDLQELKIEGSGRVIECERLEPGASFKQGEVLLRLDTSEIERAMAEAKRKHENEVELHRIRTQRSTAREVAEQRLENVRRLHALGNASQENVYEAQRELDRVLTELEVAAFQARVAEQDYLRSIEDNKIRLRKMEVVAPTDGMIESTRVNVGTLVQGGTTVATFYANERVVIAKISEEDIATVRVGDPARVQLLTFPGRDFEAKVVKRMPFANPETRRYDVYLEVEAKLSELLPNSTGEVTITVGKHERVPMIPRRAVFNGNRVLVVRDGRIEQREIELGYRALNTTEVAKGLQPGEQVVVENLDLLRPGQRVRVQQVVD